MALYYDLNVFKDVYQLILKIFEFTQGFPQEYKFTLGQDQGRHRAGAKHLPGQQGQKQDRVS
jgi:hypothetical protein